MRLIFLIIVILYNISASEINLSSILKTVVADTYIEFENQNNTSEQSLHEWLQVNLDYTHNDFYFQSTIFANNYDTISSNQMYMLNRSDLATNSEIVFRSLYMSYIINKEISVGLGILPFSNNTPMEYNNNYIKDGEGIYILNDNSLNALFLTYKTKNSKTIIGLGNTDNTIIPKGDYENKYIRNETKAFFLINTYSYKKLEITSELYYTDINYREKSMATVLLSGVSCAYNDSENLGLSIYGIIGTSIYKNNSTNVKNEILNDTFYDKPTGTGQYLSTLYPNNFTFDNKTYTGASTLLGTRFDYNIMKQEVFVNFEWFHTFNDWYSMNHTNIYAAKNSQPFNVRDDSIYFVFGWNLTANSMLQYSLNWMEFEELSTIGSSLVTVPVEDYIGPKATSVTTNMLIYTLMF